MRIIALMFFLTFATTALSADTIRIGAWNIQDFHHKEGYHLRAFDSGGVSVKRTSEDFAFLAKYRDKFGKNGGTPADLIALQEIGTKAALERLFDPSEYITIISPRWSNDSADPGEGDVYTAIAVKKDSGISVVDLDPLPELSVLHSDGRPTRAGTGALLEFEGRQFWFLSVHLKSSCPDTKAIATSTNEDCETLNKQMPFLAAWLEEKRASGIPYIIAGDYNRRFRELDFEGGVWKVLNNVPSTGMVAAPLVVAHPAEADRLCSTRKGSSKEPIDWFVMDVALANNVIVDSFWERRWHPGDVDNAQNGKGLSDHCPISIDLKFN